MKYYLVKCKFGHVGRNKYLPLSVPLAEILVKGASKKVKYFKGVKKDHKDWCLGGPGEISYDRFPLECKMFNNDIYFESRTRSRLHLFKDRLVYETNYSRINVLKTNTKKYRNNRDIDTIKYKLKKTNAILECLKDEIDVFKDNYGGIY